MIKNIFIFFITLSVIAYGQSTKVITGIEVLKESNFKILEGKKVGLITNPTGVDSKLKSTIDILYEAENVHLVALFGPEHGVRGDYAAGDIVETYTDPQTNLPVFSLYGRTRKPTMEMLEEIDILVYDIQDIGCRSYTYISTMGLAMEAAAENDIEFLVLDRPNPLGGLKVEGNLVEDGYFSFVSQFKIPYVYRLTCGELATLLNEEKMLKDEKQCKLTVIPMRNWKREMLFKDTGLEWVLTSPHVPHEYSPQYYVTSGIMGELGIVSEGIGYTLPFQVFAAEWINANVLAEKMNSLNLDGVIFRPITIKPYYGADVDKELHGVQIHIQNSNLVNLMSLQFLFMQINNELYPEYNPFKMADESGLEMFDKVMGTSKVRELFTKRMKYNDIKDYLDKDIERFKEISKKYYIY
ncbi:MAG: hypothetical protein A2315_15825 [Ignavibacteria bacterium RIFOXYB2_FULL_35_12]|nr:MAG: hypothetical protein A2006_05360 [Ignavibacteria bacterium GWC2_35_8]OGU58752.1 MAG: hypothetical protein A2X60_17250 [Ignavibacteria bacterium GWF2_35_20]OGU84530.1 MAG: hypothetical protein A3K31_08825 [Ignavibacteria bacterium RIFOXYA12_FULL_35_25]OGU92057.1 MAG: hypothetical protein A2492_01285 [Ignavibacteria bacterium RIFOXYC12_FULL_35_11]OGU95669.1 MAG: hypothetical protein A2347_00450 [Ignavibacteria bacterium RIFOXYB12_FULL_35_14]OGU99123.1 MAG: hypothetical protein A2455_0738